MRITRKLLIPTLILVGLLVIGLISYDAYLSARDFDTSEKETLRTMEELFFARILEKEDLALSLAISAANTLDIQKALAEQDRETLYALTATRYDLLKDEFDIFQEHYHLPETVSFLRLHAPDKYGDDLSDVRPTIVLANTGKIVRGLDIGRLGIGIRGVSPIYYEGTHVGAVEFGINIEQDLIERLKEEFGVDWQILISKNASDVVTFATFEDRTEAENDRFFIYASTLPAPLFSEEGSYNQVLQGTSAFAEIRDGEGSAYTILSTPLYDFAGTIIGSVDIVSNHTEALEARNQKILTDSLYLLFALIFIGVAINFVAKRTLSPIGELTETATALASGDFSKRADVTSDDEVGILANSFNTMASELEKSFGSLEERVATRTKDLATVANISTITATIRDTEEMLANLVRLTQRGFNLYHAHVFTFDKENDMLKIVACGYKDDAHQGTHGVDTIPLGQEQSLVALCARTRQPVIVNDVRNEPGWLPNAELPETRAELAVPMIVGDELLGVLDVQSERLDAFSEEDANIQMTLASQIATALQNIQSYERAQKRAELESLANVIGQRIQRSNSIEETLQIAIRELGVAIGAKRVDANLQPESSKEE